MTFILYLFLFACIIGLFVEVIETMFSKPRYKYISPGRYQNLADGSIITTDVDANATQPMARDVVKQQFSNRRIDR